MQIKSQKSAVARVSTALTLYCLTHLSVGAQVVTTEIPKINSTLRLLSFGLELLIWGVIFLLVTKIYKENKLGTRFQDLHSKVIATVALIAVAIIL